MRPTKFTYTPADNDTDGYANDVTGAGPFVPTLTANGDGLAHLTTLSSTANLSAVTFTLTGTDADGMAQTEALAGPNNNTVVGVKYFRTVTLVTAGATLGANTMDVGWSDVSVGPTFMLNWRQQDFQTRLAVDITGTIDVTAQFCLDDIASLDVAPSTLVWWPDPTIAAVTADTNSLLSAPVVAVRLLVNSLTAGAIVTLHVLQGQ